MLMGHTDKKKSEECKVDAYVLLLFGLHGAEEDGHVLFDVDELLLLVGPRARSCHDAARSRPSCAHADTQQGERVRWSTAHTHTHTWMRWWAVVPGDDSTSLEAGEVEVEW